MKKLPFFAVVAMLASCSYMDMEDSRDYHGYYNSPTGPDQLEYKEMAAVGNQPAEVNGHATEAPKNYPVQKNGVPLQAPDVN